MINLKEIENKWQKIWEEKRVFEVSASEKPKFFATFPYPYVNGLLHLGSFITSSRVEFISRFKKLQGYNVLFAQGWHATGSPIVAMAHRLREGDEKLKKVIELLEEAYKKKELIDSITSFRTDFDNFSSRKFNKEISFREGSYHRKHYR